MGKAIDFVKNISYEEFIRDDKTVFAVVRADVNRSNSRKNKQ